MNTDELTNPPCPSASGYRRPTSRSVVSGENANADQQVLWDSHPPNNPYYSTTLRARAHTQKHRQTISQRGVQPVTEVVRKAVIRASQRALQRVRGQR